MNSTWNTTTFSCNVPTAVELVILFTNAGSSESPQPYILNSEARYIYETISFADIYNNNYKYRATYSTNANNETISQNQLTSQTKNITFKFIVDFVQLYEEDFTITRSDTPFRISFPFNFTNPFT